MQWDIGFTRNNIEQIIREKKCTLSFKWMPLNDSIKSIADPFVFKDTQGILHLFYEDFSMINLAEYGKIFLATLDKDFNVTSIKELLDTQSHTSYPFIFDEAGKTYIIPETSVQGKLSAYEYDFTSKSLVNEKVIINNLPLLDATILKYNDKYWLFATKSENGLGNAALFIYYSDTLFGKYESHANNPVKICNDGARPAGKFIEVDGEIYRPTQNCRQHYGASISINKITQLSENYFSEELYFKILPDKSSAYNAGVHTINIVDDIIVIDGIKMLFKPLLKWQLFFKKLRKKDFFS